MPKQGGEEGWRAEGGKKEKRTRENRPDPQIRKILVSVNVFCPQFCGRNGCPSFMGAWKDCLLSAGKPHNHKSPRFRGEYFGFFGGVGNADFIFMGARIFLTKIRKRVFRGQKELPFRNAPGKGTVSQKIPISIQGSTRKMAIFFSPQNPLVPILWTFTPVGGGRVRKMRTKVAPFQLQIMSQPLVTCLFRCVQLAGFLSNVILANSELTAIK